MFVYLLLMFSFAGFAISASVPFAAASGRAQGQVVGGHVRQKQSDALSER